MKTHTPGPWRVYEIKGSSRMRIMSDAVPYDVATMSHAGGEDAEAANAMLIAAAPELLAACKLAVRWLREMTNDVDAETDLIDIQEAIDKAEGRDE